MRFSTHLLEIALSLSVKEGKKLTSSVTLTFSMSLHKFPGNSVRLRSISLATNFHLFFRFRAAEDATALAIISRQARPYDPPICYPLRKKRNFG